jgi:hypothetical protein
MKYEIMSKLSEQIVITFTNVITGIIVFMTSIIQFKRQSIHLFYSKSFQTFHTFIESILY